MQSSPNLLEGNVCNSGIVGSAGSTVMLPPKYSSDFVLLLIYILFLHCTYTIHTHSPSCLHFPCVASELLKFSTSHHFFLLKTILEIQSWEICFRIELLWHFYGWVSVVCHFYHNICKMEKSTDGKKTTLRSLSHQVLAHQCADLSSKQSNENVQTWDISRHKAKLGLPHIHHKKRGHLPHINHKNRTHD